MKTNAAAACVAGTILSLAGLASAQQPGLDGIWRLREGFCVSAAGQRQCGRGVEQFLIAGDKAYYGGSDGEDWTEAATVATKGRRVVIRVTPEGLARVGERLFGVSIEGYLGNARLTYSGLRQGGRIVAGQLRADVTIDLGDRNVRVRGSGTFTGKRIGDVCCIVPPDGEGVEGGMSSGQDSTRAARGGDAAASGFAAAVEAACSAGAGIHMK